MRKKVELIIIGNTRGAIAKLMMGDIVKAVVRKAAVPVLLVLIAACRPPKPGRLLAEHLSTARSLRAGGG